MERVLTLSLAHPETGQAAGAQALQTSRWTLQYRNSLTLRATLPLWEE